MPKPNNNPFFWTKLELNTFLKTHKLPSTGSTLQKRRLAHTYLKNKKQTMHTNGFPLFRKSKSKDDLHDDSGSTNTHTKGEGAVGGGRTVEQLERELAEMRERIAQQEVEIQRERRHQPAPSQPFANVSILSHLQPFDGTRGADVAQFFEKIDRLANLGHWTDLDKLNVLGLKLEGQARTYWETLHGTTPNITYRAAKSKVIERFTQETTPGDLLQQFTTLKLKDNESIDSLADRISAIHTKILNTNGNDQLQTLLKLLEQMTIDSFINALPPRVAKHVKVMFPKTLEEARRLAQMLYAIDIGCTETPIFAVHNDTDDTDTGPPTTQRRETKTDRDKKPPTPCKFCQGNHWNSECKKRNSYSPSSSRSSSRTNSRASFRASSRSSSPSTRTRSGSPYPSKSFNKKSRCYNCNGLGHFSRECTVRRNKPQRGHTYKTKCQICQNTGHAALECHLFSKLTSKN